MKKIIRLAIAGAFIVGPLAFGPAPLVSSATAAPNKCTVQFNGQKAWKFVRKNGALRYGGHKLERENAGQRRVVLNIGKDRYELVGAKKGAHSGSLTLRGKKVGKFSDC